MVVSSDVNTKKINRRHEKPVPMMMGFWAKPKMKRVSLSLAETISHSLNIKEMTEARVNRMILCFQANIDFGSLVTIMIRKKQK